MKLTITQKKLLQKLKQNEERLNEAMRDTDLGYRLPFGTMVVPYVRARTKPHFKALRGLAEEGMLVEVGAERVYTYKPLPSGWAQEND